MSENNNGGLAARMPTRYNFAIGLLLFAAIITVAKKNGAQVPAYALLFGISIGIGAIIAEMTTAADVVRSWYHGRIGGMVGSAAIWSVAFFFAINNWLGAASEGQAEKTNVHKASYNSYQSSQDTLKAAKAEHHRLAERLSWMNIAIGGKPVRSVEAAQATIDNAMSHRFWKLTEECTTTKGPQTRAHCDAYRDAIGEKTLAVEKETLVVEVKAALDELKKATEVAAKTPAQTSESRADLAILTSYAGMSENGAEQFNAVFSIAALSVFLSFFMGRKELEALKAEGPRKKFNWFSKVYRAVYKAIFGAEPASVTIIHDTRTGQNIRAALLDAGYGRTA